MDSKQDRLKGLHLLLVDDSELILQLVIRYLKRWGVEYMTVDNAFDAINLIAMIHSPQGGAHPPIDAVLMDVHLPGLDGTTAAKEIASIRPGLPVIAMTGDDSVPPVFAGYLRKPIRPGDLYQKLCEILAQDR